MKSIVLIASLGSLAIAKPTWSIGQKVDTKSGPVTGHASSWKPDVSEYLGIPFAQPPVGDLRFAPPKAFTGSKPIDGTKYGKNCPENIGGPADRSANATAGEDCLTLNVWTKPQTGEKAKAVMIWVYGGGFGMGKTSDILYDGARLADDNDVVLVSMNYRTNIFGFPRAPWLKEKNPALLDQRLAIEWIRDKLVLRMIILWLYADNSSIAAFGGDPKRMILFGQSAGSASVDMYSFAYAKDPIVYGLIAESGLASNPATPTVNASSGWFQASQKLGCGGEEAGEKTMPCMRTKKWEDILDSIERRGVTPNLGAGGFGPSYDGISVMPDYNKRRAEGNFAHLVSH
ncbi:alpha/beta-hydrolase [Microthyrium microscopicum]|uniref:Carboxylic ester hydrolase n=1 Tax=Microthyrium microscopicum TaxID=703497 RepID=A0A6A6UJH3_9PEZI|nr:alpha/beta-hydrolase [Microthyrium microscopicum]